MILATVSQSEPSINVNYEVLAGDTSTVQYSTVLPQYKERHHSSDHFTGN